METWVQITLLIALAFTAIALAALKPARVTIRDYERGLPSPGEGDSAS